MKNKYFKNKNIKFFIPQTKEDIEDIAGNLIENESSILVNMSECNVNKDELSEIIEFVLSVHKSKISINIKKVYCNVFVCWSKPLKKRC